MVVVAPEAAKKSAQIQILRSCVPVLYTALPILCAVVVTLTQLVSGTPVQVPLYPVALCDALMNRLLGIEAFKSKVKLKSPLLVLWLSYTMNGTLAVCASGLTWFSSAKPVRSVVAKYAS